jgi:RNA polymerase sigma-70 factor (ECF subfamily)
VQTVQPTSAATAQGRAAFSRVYDEFFDFVYRNARRLGVPASAADDVVQDVFVVLHRRLPEYDGRASMQSWVYGILANTVRDFRRSFRRKQAPLVSAEHDEELGAASSRASPETRVERGQDVALLLELLDELSDAQRELIVLADIEQLSIPEICACIGGNSNTVYSRLRVARETLKSKLARRRSAAAPKAGA